MDLHYITHLYSTFLFIIHIHSHAGPVWVECLAQGHFDMQTGGATLSGTEPPTAAPQPKCVLLSVTVGVLDRGSHLNPLEVQHIWISAVELLFFVIQHWVHNDYESQY